MKRGTVPTTGAARGLLSHHIRQIEAPLYAVTHRDDGTTLVPLEGTPDICATVNTDDWRRLTADHHKHANSPALTRTRWALEGGEVRALSLHDRPRMGDYSYSVAALILGAKDGDVIHLDDYRDLRPQAMRLEPKRA